MQPLRKGLPSQGPALRPLDLSPAISAIQERHSGVDLDDVLPGFVVPNAMVDQGAEVGSLAVVDFDHGRGKIEQHALEPFPITLPGVAPDGLEKGIRGESDMAAGAIDPREMQAMLPDIEIGLTQARAIEDNGQTID